MKLVHLCSDSPGSLFRQLPLIAFGLILPWIILPPHGQAQEKTEPDTKLNTASPWELMDVKTQASLRGLHVVNESIVWASGTEGTIVNTVDGGATWKTQVVPGAEALDFRDIHAIDDNTIVALTSGTPARIYRSSDGGSKWIPVYENTDERVFLDAMAFVNGQHGFVMGDPTEEKLFLLQTTDGGKTWGLVPNVPATQPGEAGFAASGSNMIARGPMIAIALGGALPDRTHPNSRILISPDAGKNWTVADVPMARTPSAGIFSICFADALNGVAVGGDYRKPVDTTSNIAVTHDGGKTWSTPDPGTPPSGYRSGVATWTDGQVLTYVTVGTNGTDVSTDLGKKWDRVSEEGFHAVEFSADGRHGWATGAGRIAKWRGPRLPQIKK